MAISASVPPASGAGSSGRGTETRARAPRVIAHRGASGYAPENTLPAFERALELGAHEVELDVQLTRDGELILFHDRSLQKKTNGSGRVRDHDLAELRKLDIGSWFDRTHPGGARSFAGTGLMTLGELFDTFGSRLFYHVELKSDEPELPERVLLQIRRAALEEAVLITSFHEPLLERMRALDGSIPIGLLVGDERDLRASPESGSDRAARTLQQLQERWIDLALRARFDQVAFPASEMTRAGVEYAHSRGLEIRAYRVRTRADMEHALAVGSDGMTLNWPDWLLERAGRGGAGH